MNKNYSVWAKKGDVWNNTAHLVKGSQSTTLCGLPLLGNNYAKEVKEIGCEICKKKYYDEQETLPKID